jgi:hypothetical protein
MIALNVDQVREITNARQIQYEPIDDPNPLIVRTRMSRDFPIPQETFFNSFADPVSHVGLFAIIKSSTPPIREGLEGVLGDNQFFAFEHVEEGPLNPRIMLLRYTLEPPNTILKEGVTDPFLPDDLGDPNSDRKKAVVKMDFEPINENETRIITESSFHATTGAIFARGFIDSVWLNFYEKMLVANGQLSEHEMMTE